MNTFYTAFSEIQKLVAQFKQGEKHYLSPSYNETEVRKDFIDKFFIALGWDVNHDSQPDPYQQEVKVEKTQDNQKRTDYTFFLSPNFKDPKFFVEAKKPSQHLHSADYYFQTIRYGWNSKTPVAVLTDFEEFHILDCRIRPDINKVLEGFHKQYSYTDYSDKEKFSEIYYLFSHVSVAEGSLERYADSLPKPKGKAAEKGVAKSKTQSIDEEFLEYIDRIRESLAKAFKKNDENLGSEELTEATQRTIDRLVFIRFLEDKLIEQDNYVNEFGKSYKAWTDFITVCRRLDSKYNGIVFKKHFIDEQNFRGPELNEFRNICNEISHQNTPYDFNAIPIHILGSIYERFLGKVVHATDKRVKVEEKPEVRKAGGVYYTPKYIVDYIVENTIGKILRNENDSLPSETPPLVPMLQRRNVKGKSPAEISKLRFADIACGSGSFLIGAFECLLDYHKKYYQQHKSQALKDGCIEKDGIMVLSIKQKQNILLNNIYGVDIDQQAVEVTQLSLALKMLEDETTATANDMQVLFKEKILPDLSKNIICGNSLIGTDILSGSMFASDEERKLNPMDFESTFPEVFIPKKVVIPAKAGIQKDSVGFDAIIGNPPYVNAIQLSELLGIDAKKYLKDNYYSTKGTFDLYIPFFERALKLIKFKGLVSYITPNKYLSAPYGKEFRKFISDNYTLIEISDYSSVKVFDKPSVYPLITIIQNEKDSKKNDIRVNIYKNHREYLSNKISSSYLSMFPENIWGILLNKNISIIEKSFNNSLKLIDIGEVNATSTAAESDEFSNYIYDNNPKFHKLINTGTIDRYSTTYGITYLSNKGKKYLFPVLDLSKINNRRKELYKKPKIIFAKIALEIESFLDSNGEYASINTNCVYDLKEGYSLKYLSGILNSKLMTFIYSQLFSALRMSGGYYQFQAPQIKILPIKKSVAMNELFEKLVDQMFESKKQLQLSKTDKDKTYYERKCDALDKQIDSEVYKLYGLTEEEIKIVEVKE